MAQKTPIGDMPRMVPDRDDIRRRSHPVPEKKPSGKPGPKEPSSGGASWMMITLLLVSGAAIAYLALQQYSMTQLLTSYEERLELADDRIVSLERALTETDESVSMNGTAINAQFKAIKGETDMQMSEIRKLWDVANKRNRQWIEDNQAALASQQEKIAGLSTKITAVETAQGADQERLAEVAAQLATEQTRVASLVSGFEEVDAELGTVNRAIESLLQTDYEERILTLTLTQENLQAEQGTLNATVSDNLASLNELQETLRAVNAGRQETNARLSALRSQLDTLDARVTGLTGP